MFNFNITEVFEDNRICEGYYFKIVTINKNSNNYNTITLGPYNIQDNYDEMCEIYKCISDIETFHFSGKTMIKDYFEIKNFDKYFQNQWSIYDSKLFS